MMTLHAIPLAFDLALLLFAAALDPLCRLADRLAERTMNDRR